jgi:hypothetical protein
MTIEKKLLGTSPSGGDAPNVEDVFSTYLYTGTSSTQTITNGIDLAGEGGMVWLKCRDNAHDNQIYDTERGVTNHLRSNSAGVEGTQSTSLTSFNSDGFTIGSLGWINFLNNNWASWTFRKAPRFFDVVTYIGNGSATQTMSHSLGSVPGMIIVKNKYGMATGNWTVWHRSLGATTGKYIRLNTTDSTVTDSTAFPIAATSTEFTVGRPSGANDQNANVDEFVAYLFAHDPDGANDDGMIACGSFTNVGGKASVSIGWEPQYLLIKNSSGIEEWNVVDTMRGLIVGTTSAGLADATLAPNHSGAEINTTRVGYPTADGFEIENLNTSDTYIYMAIRAPMMKEPEAGTEVFSVAEQFDTATTTTGFPVDMFMNGLTQGNAHNFVVVDRLRGSTKSLETNNTDHAETSAITSSATIDSNTSYRVGSFGANSSQLAFKRAKGFFDVVAYTGSSSVQNIQHSLGVAPEMIWAKNRTGRPVNDAHWQVYHKANTATDYNILNTNSSSNSFTGAWNNTEPTSTVFTLGTLNWVNVSPEPNIAYLFATLAGVSKVGNYTGNGSSQNIACGFSGGARFVMIKRTDSTGDWYIWDTARGIVTGNDPHFSLNTQAAEVTSDDSIDPQSAGFTVNQVTATNINVTNGTYIFLAIA